MVVGQMMYILTRKIVRGEHNLVNFFNALISDSDMYSPCPILPHEVDILMVDIATDIQRALSVAARSEAQFL
jgi:hypothetical protein